MYKKINFLYKRKNIGYDNSESLTKEIALRRYPKYELITSEICEFQNFMVVLWQFKIFRFLKDDTRLLLLKSFQLTIKNY